MAFVLHFRHGPERFPLAHAAGSVFGALRGAVAAVAHFIQAEIDRRQTMKLLGSDDRMLSDIGITRADVYAALLTSAGEKASEHLSDVRRERRAAERAQALEVRAQASDGE